MSRRQREDDPGSLHHVYNRGIAKRTMFESRRDMRMFLAQLALAHRRGEIEIHAFCLLGTHFHLLLYSLRGGLGESMQRIQTAYSRYFNRGRRRDGALVRGRFCSRVVKTEAYLLTLLSYIEMNPVQARIVTAAADYEFSSARPRRSNKFPRWLTRFDFECGEAFQVSEMKSLDLNALTHVVEARMEGIGGDPKSDFPAAPGNDAVRRWLIRKAQLADGTRPDQPVCDVATVRTVVADMDEVELTAFEVAKQAPGSRRRQIRFFLLRDLAGLKLADIGQMEDITASAVSKVLRRHQLEFVKNPDYVDLVARTARRCFELGPMGLLMGEMEGRRVGQGD